MNNYCPQCGKIFEIHDDFACNFRWNGKHWTPDLDVIDDGVGSLEDMESEFFAELHDQREEMSDERDPNEVLKIEDGDFEKPGLDLGSLKLMANLHGALMDETNRLTNSLMDGYKQDAEDRGAALEDALFIANFLEQEIPRSSEGGRLCRLLYHVLNHGAYTSSYGRYQKLDRSLIYYPGE